MVTVRHTLTALLAAGILLAGLAAPAAHAAPAAGGYGYNQVLGIASAVSADVSIGEYSTVVGSRIWINGKPTCLPFGPGVVTWCGVAGGNGTAQLDTGLNYQAQDNAGHLHKYYLRFELYAAGECLAKGDFNGYYGQVCRQ